MINRNIYINKSAISSIMALAPDHYDKGVADYLKHMRRITRCAPCHLQE